MTVEQRFWSKVDKSAGVDGCWLWTASRDGHNYGKFMLTPGHLVTAHRLAWRLVTGEDLPSEIELCHRCDNPPCVNPAHQFKGTHGDNMRDAAGKSRLPGRRQLSIETFEAIERARGTASQAEVARQFGASQQTVSRIWRGAHRKSQPNWKPHPQTDGGATLGGHV